MSDYTKPVPHLHVNSMRCQCLKNGLYDLKTSRSSCATCTIQKESTRSRVPTSSGQSHTTTAKTANDTDLNELVSEASAPHTRHLQHRHT